MAVALKMSTLKFERAKKERLEAIEKDAKYFIIQGRVGSWMNMSNPPNPEIVYEVFKYINDSGIQLGFENSKLLLLR